MRLAIDYIIVVLVLVRLAVDYVTAVRLCFSRSKDVIEPLLKPQWYVNCTSMAQRACDAVRSGELKIIPSMFEKTWFSWLDNCRCAYIHFPVITLHFTIL